MASTSTPEHILIVGAGVFGVSTALSLISNPAYNSTKLTVVDGSPSLPNPSGSSVDASRIVRADYAYKHYASLALDAQELWRDRGERGWGGQGRYHEPGFVLTAEGDRASYMRESLKTVKKLAEDDKTGRSDPTKIHELNTPDEIRKATGFEGVSGDFGYANFNSGWADAGACVAYALKRLAEEGGDRVTIRSGADVSKLIFSDSQCRGVELDGGEQILADLTVLAAGAWAPSLVDLQGRCLATGQALAYLSITDDEQTAMAHRPTVINMTNGMFIIPPRGNELKIARHGYGYLNPVRIPRANLHPQSSPSEYVEVSVPKIGLPIGLEAEDAFRAALRELVPHMADRPFSRTRICWYCDTPTGDFLITYHPRYQGLFLATGGSGHGFKFFPVIGDRIAAAIQGTLDPELAELWRWRSDAEVSAVLGGKEFTGCDDGSRSGARGMILEEELGRTR